MGYTSSDSNHAVKQIALSRRFRAIKLWIVICRYGLTSLMDHILSDVEMVKRFEALVIKTKLQFQGSELNRKLLDAVNSIVGAFISHSVMSGVYFIRSFNTN